MSAPRRYPSEFVFSLFALAITFVIVHSIYVLDVRPKAQVILAEQRAGMLSDPNYIADRSFYVLVKDYEQESEIILFIWALAIIGYKAKRQSRERKTLEGELLALPEGMKILPEDTREYARQIESLRPEARNVAIDLLCEGDGLIALADSQRAVQVIGNLVTNALKYGAAGERVLMRASRLDDWIRIEVTDFGPGLTAQKQAQLFEPFNRLGLERSTIEGHGVGLALAKRLVELQGGSIGVISAPGEGATFWILLPKA